MGLASTAAFPYATFVTVNGLTYLYGTLIKDTNVEFGITSSLAAGIYGGPNKGNSYTDNGTNYGGIDGNSSPDGRAINGF